MKLHTEKRIAPFVATQIHSHAKSVRKQSLHFYRSKNARFDMRNLNLCGFSIIPHQIHNYKQNQKNDLIQQLEQRRSYNFGAVLMSIAPG